MQASYDGAHEKEHEIHINSWNMNQNAASGDQAKNQKDDYGDNARKSRTPSNRNVSQQQRKSGRFDYMQFAKGDKDHSQPPNENLQPFTWRGKLRNFLHSKPCHIAVIVLVLIDTALVITEILLDLHIVEVGEDNPAPEIVHYCSITILSIFMIEIAAKLLADWQHFWSHKMEIFDAIVVVVAFAFDVAILFIENEAAVALGLIVLLRLWRIVRIINGIILTAKNEADERAHALKEKIKEGEEEIEKLQKKTEKQEKEIKKLRDILQENGIHVEEEPEDGDEEQKGEVVVQLQDTDHNISVET